MWMFGQQQAGADRGEAQGGLRASVTYVKCWPILGSMFG
jgi:hypothetical protein